MNIAIAFVAGYVACKLWDIQIQIVLTKLFVAVKALKSKITKR